MKSVSIKKLLLAGIIIGFSFPLTAMETTEFGEPFIQSSTFAPLAKLIAKGWDAQVIQHIRPRDPILLQKDKFGRTLLIIAVQNNRVEVVKALLAQGADANVQDIHGKTALTYAQKGGNEQIITLLQGKSIPQPMPTTSTVPATRSKQTAEPIKQTGIVLEKLDALKAIGPNRYPENYNALKVVKGLIEQQTSQADEAAVKIIKSNPTLVNLEMQYGRTLLMLAAQNGRITIIDALLKAGADINYPDTNGNTPVALAAGKGYSEVVKFLDLHGAGLALYNRKKQTPLNHALMSGDKKTIDLLVAAVPKLFFTVVVSFSPVNAQELASSTYKELTRLVGTASKDLKLVPLEEVHLSMLYFSFFVDYDVKKNEIAPDDILVMILDQVEQFNLKQKCIQLTDSHPFKVAGLEKMGPYVVIRYTTPQGYQQLTDELFQRVKRSINLPVLQTYDEAQNPHISFAQEVVGRKFDANLLRGLPLPAITTQPLTKATFSTGSYALNMRYWQDGNMISRNLPLF